MRVQLEGYLRGETGRVHSLVASIPFSPVDIDLNLLTRGGWDASKDRLRIWYLPSTEGEDDRASGYVMVRKVDQREGVMVCLHVVMNLQGRTVSDEPPYFTIGILSNDDSRARAALGMFLGVPPIFHDRSEVTLIEDRWRTDPATVMRFAANVHSAISAGGGAGPSGRLKFEPPAGLVASLKPGLENWWDSAGEDQPASSPLGGAPDEGDTTMHKS